MHALRKPARERLRLVMQFAEGNGRLFLAAVGEENVGSLVRLVFRAPGQQCDKRTVCIHANSGRSSGRGCALVGEIARQGVDGWIVVEIIGRQFDAELLFQLHHEIDEHC